MRSLYPLAVLAAAAAVPLPAARADVVIQQQTSVDLAIIKAHGTTSESTTADKQRRDSEFHCEGLMSLLCGNAQSGEIVRLDRDLRWELDPKKKEYREAPFPTPAERQAAERQAQEMMDKIKQCPVPPGAAAPAPDTSKCEMTPPAFDVKATDTHATLAGHDARLAQVTMTQSCRNRDTGDECGYAFVLESWLTQDQIAALAEDKAFRSTYRQKLGLGERSDLIPQQMQRFLAQYQDSLRQLSAKSAELKGEPLKTTVRIAFGGEHCAAAKQRQGAAGGGNAVGDAGQAATNAAASATAGAAGSAAGAEAAKAAGNSAAGSVFSSAANAFGSKLASGLFTKKKPDAPAAAAPAAAGGLPAGMVQLAQLGVETTSIATGPVPAAQFDIPPGWKLIPREEHAAKEFSCPKAGN